MNVTGKATIVAALLLIVQLAGAKEIIQARPLNLKLKQVNAAWVAKDSIATGMTQQEAQHFLGLSQPHTASVEFVAPSSLSYASSNLPRTLDWRNKDGKNWVSPILNQGSCGSCVAFASIGVLETQYKIASSVFDYNVKLSPQNLFACGGGHCNWGWMPGPAASYIQTHGVPDESCLPYISGATGQDVACRASCADSAQRSVRIASFSTPSRGMKDLDALRTALQNGPLVTTLSVYEDFMAYSSGVYKHVTGVALGGHAVSIVGYDDDQQAFIIRNSWGTEWGEQGFAHVSYDDISGIGEETWLYNVPTLSGAVSLQSPMDYSYYSGKVPFKAFSSFATTDSLQLVVTDAQNKAVWSGACATANCTQDLDVRHFGDGKYQAQVLAMDKTGAQIGASSPQFFYVANQKPTLTLSFAGHNVDLGKAVKARIEFDITAGFNSVPMNVLEFHFRGPDGKETVRTSQVVLNHMLTGWRTNLVPNGTYDVWMVGRVATDSQNTFVESAHTNIIVSN